MVLHRRIVWLRVVGLGTFRDLHAEAQIPMSTWRVFRVAWDSRRWFQSWRVGMFEMKWSVKGVIVMIANSSAVVVNIANAQEVVKTWGMLGVTIF